MTSSDLSDEQPVLTNDNRALKSELFHSSLFLPEVSRYIVTLFRSCHLYNCKDLYHKMISSLNCMIEY